MKYDDVTWKKIEAGRAALENLAPATRTGRTVEQSLLLSNRQLIFSLIEHGVEKKEICDTLSAATGVSITLEMLTDFVAKNDTNKIDFSGASEAIKKLTKKPDMVKYASTSVVTFLQKNKSEILQLIETGLSMRKVMGVLRKHGITCSPDTVKRHIGYVPKKRKKREKINDNKLPINSDKKTQSGVVNQQELPDEMSENSGMAGKFIDNTNFSKLLKG